MTHDFNRCCRPDIRNGGTDHQLNAVVFEYGAFVQYPASLWKGLDVVSGEVILFGKNGDQFGTGIQHGAGLAIDVVVV